MRIEKVDENNFEDFFSMIVELAKYEKLQPPDEGAKKRLLNDLTKDNPIVFGYVSYHDNKPIGYLISFFAYSSFLAKPTYYIEDLYIKKEHRKKGFGQKFFDFAKQHAVKNNCGRMEWIALNWNEPAINFYKKNNAKKMDEWSLFRVEL